MPSTSVKKRSNLIIKEFIQRGRKSKFKPLLRYKLYEKSEAGHFRPNLQRHLEVKFKVVTLC